MKSAISLSSLLVSACLLFSSCIMPAPVPGPFYISPKVTEEPTAFLTGSARNNTIGSLFSAFPFAIDNLRVENASDRWSIPLPLRPGRRIINAEFNYLNRYARADLELAAKEYEDYVVKFTTDAGLPRGDSFCEFWLEDAKSGKALTSVVRVNLLKK